MREHDSLTANSLAAGSLAVAPAGGVDGFEMRFQSLFDAGRALSFPCDAQGRVALDELSDRARVNYLYARAVVGREFAAPAIVASVH